MLPIAVRDDVGVDEPVREHLLPAPACSFGEALAERVVDIDHARVEPGPGEQARLCRPVRRHRPVVIEVIAGQIGEQRDVELDAVDATLVERMRRDLHRDRARAGVAHLRERRMDERGIRRRVRRGLQRADEAVAERADDPGAPAARVEALRDPVRARSLAVGAGDPCHPQRPRRISVDEGGDRAELRLEVVDREIGDFPCRVPAKAECVPQHRVGATRDRVRDEGAPVGGLPAVRGEHVARTHEPAVGADSARNDRESRDELGRVESGVDQRRHHVSSWTSAPSGGRMTLSSGASGGVPSIRSADPITDENTGAATSPP